ncbi:hypothetical protein EW026_g1898 [Hermanssonia centrifuga]|uniref:Pali-domain-containing protein n=1 Tax=Hermanssonia centrifuga TaxID=98765 RepID=A0A4S4KQX4_9APHY|nr:hypothetical protein EW026_g1898 [Hermanssonia centrifuga]
MGLVRPATPGFLVTLAATALLAVVSFSVPYFKSVFFLKASLSSEGVDGSITFGTLGYCVQLPNGTTCSKPSVGYQLDINALVGDNTPIQIPNVLVKWLTYALVLHIVALILAAISAFFGLLAHVREMSMVCCSTFVSGFGASVALLAFIFDLALFFVAKSRINAVKGGSASIGLGIWLTLAAWILLFFAGCFFGLGRCCVRRRSRDQDRQAPQVDNGYAEQMRLEAVKAEADRKNRQKQGEIGLPPFQEYDPMQPLTKPDPAEESDEGYNGLAYRPGQQSSPGMAAYARQGNSASARPYAGGYSQAPVGTRAVDDYYNASPSTTYPPQPRRQGSNHTQSSSRYAPSAYNNVPVPPVPAVGTVAAGQYLAAGSQHGHSQYPSAAMQDYGHPRRGTTYHSATSHQQEPTNYSTQYPENTGAFNVDTYNNTAQIPNIVTPYSPSSTPYSSRTAPNMPYAQGGAYNTTPQDPPARSYTLGGGGYSDSTVPVLAEQHSGDANYFPHYSNEEHFPSPYSPLPTPASSRTATTATPPPSAGPSGPRGPLPPSFEEPQYEDSPPVYDDATAQPAGEWNSKR